jgi:hypothetical protein
MYAVILAIALSTPTHITIPTVIPQHTHPTKAELLRKEIIRYLTIARKALRKRDYQRMRGALRKAKKLALQYRHMKNKGNN